MGNNGLGTVNEEKLKQNKFNNNMWAGPYKYYKWKTYGSK
jgi:hypothetical protein